MQAQWKHVLIKTTIWLAAEVALNLLGVDNLADYGEFVFGRKSIIASYFESAIALTLIYQSES